MNNVYRAAIIAGVCIMLFAPGVGAAEIALTMDEAVTIALRDNRDVLMKAEDLRKAQARIAEARAALLPGADAAAGWSHTRGFYDKSLSVYSWQVGASQLLYAGGKLVNAVRAGEHTFTATEAALDVSRQGLVLNVKKTFYALVLAKELLAVNKGILDNTREHLDLVLARYRSGQASESDVLSLRASLSAVRQAYEESFNQLQQAAATLKNLLYLDKDASISVQGELRYEARETAYDQAFLLAMKSRPEIRQLEAQVRAAQSGVEAAKAGNRPTVAASWDYYNRSHGVTGTQKNWNDYTVAALTVSWPIFDGWLTRSKVQQALIDVKETQLLKEKTAADIALELKNAYLSLQNALAQLHAMEAQIEMYRDRLAVIEEKYKAGITSRLDQHDAALSYRIAVFNQTQSIYDYLIAKAQFDKATGGH
ncbi:MAG TPA: TolC family protein [Candidatus Omnitrophota bacterium]|nr:TolC family protein [Candidatus Omnitrophota bacterium]